MKYERAAGVLLHPTSLPGPYGIGDIGATAHAYVDWLAAAGISWWQILPLNAPGEGFSPYSARSTFAGNPLLLSPEALAADGLLEPAEFAAPPPSRPDRVLYPAVLAFKNDLVQRAFERFRTRPPAALAAAFDRYRSEEASWLHDWGLFAALRTAHAGAGWFDWPRPLALREPAAIAAWREAHAPEIELHVFAQFLFARQWSALRAHAAARGVRIMGDLPMFVALDSAEVWAHRELFRLDASGLPTHVAGVPPDYFNENGQLWGNPLYAWETKRVEVFEWWIERIRRVLETVDAVRLDHFRGFAEFWEVPAGAKTAKTGRWVAGPGAALFEAIRAALGDLPFVAEDLGDIDAKVTELRDRLGLPGMAVLQFAFNPSPRSTFLPYRHERHLVVYTGTHDNNTTRGWYDDDADDAMRDYLRRYFATDGREVHWTLVRAAMASVADLAVVPHQDLVGLGSAGRMNRPGTVTENWDFRLSAAMLDRGTRDRLGELVWLYGRRPDQQERDPREP